MGRHAVHPSPAQPASRSATIAGSLPRDDDSAAGRQRRIAAYLARIPPAVSGQRGHDRTFHAACVLVKGFSLTLDEARPLLREWNERCAPPWSTAELEHKLESAPAPDDRPRGYLRSDRSSPQEAARPRKAAISEVAPAARKATDPTGRTTAWSSLPMLRTALAVPRGRRLTPTV